MLVEAHSEARRTSDHSNQIHAAIQSVQLTPDQRVRMDRAFHKAIVTSDALCVNLVAA